ncbi:hypothetical protein TEQG_01887 [Trichophyton equinum CBS 127.97]|uniref:Uncharacterized protein n=1 Tax=Trichophyton equinum (strain ATCC MYA-4606 / CBS 127.97) TaxID=559882 RepID=F2PLT1_TRIEC|nr:hypothetical protein TEQG_01887 [Trichophyton equinum CBS 127.97]
MSKGARSSRRSRGASENEYNWALLIRWLAGEAAKGISPFFFFLVGPHLRFARSSSLKEKAPLQPAVKGAKPELRDIPCGQPPRLTFHQRRWAQRQEKPGLEKGSPFDLTISVRPDVKQSRMQGES